MRRNPRRRNLYRSYHGNRRRRRRVNPLFLVLILALAARAGFLAYRHFFAADPVAADGPAEPPAGAAQDESDPVPPEHLTTPSGIPCTLTELGEDAIYTGDLILVNNWTFFHFPEEQELAVIFNDKSDSYYVRDMEVLLAPHALTALNAMLDDFRAQGGSKSVNVVAGHRTAEFQQHLFDQSAELNGLEHAQQFVAQPGGSEHHTGLTVDFSILHGDGSSAEYRGTGEYAWINSSCQNYGWVVRYDLAKVNLTGISNEPWHFRYVGVPHATEIVEQNLCLEEYIDYLKQFPFDGEHLTVECADGTYEIWYTEGTQVYLPDSGEYTVSGNNVDGVIVTYKVG